MTASFKAWPIGLTWLLGEEGFTETTGASMGEEGHSQLNGKPRTHIYQEYIYAMKKVFRA